MTGIPGNNSTGSLVPQNPFHFEFIPWAFFNILVIVCGALGNILVVLAYRNPRMKTVTNLFIANLAFADLNVVLINVPMNILKTGLETWPFGGAICKIVTSLLAITLAASVGSLIAIAVDRHRAIVHPLKPRMRTRHAFYIIIAIWISAIALATPLLVFSKVNSQGCLEDWPSGTVNWQQVYSVLLFVTMYVLPLGTMSGLYLMIYLNLMEKKPLQKSAHRARVSVVRMLIMVIVIFALCWLPFHVMIIAIDLKNSDEPTFYAMCFALWLTTANSSFNPIIYAVFNLNYRREFARILTCGTVNVGKYLGCDTSIDDPRSHFSRATFNKSQSQPLALVSKVNGGNGKVYVENKEEERGFLERKEINGNNYGDVRNTYETSSRTQGEPGGSCDQGHVYESCC
ncbi:neuropeptide FF receptor 2-like [Actinia tenebrosa]|uniref:Neuropeptide FF receptor 2-like n=1 Tax=Actinia tenebrosa TaxID=6105 RepID=A0A6P8IAP8_ACTTE|nr:neuropeptide FF receptor 2-like [Actinia tenebrosa]XP_031562317.1 neuropeptide FF receptor 2-like [Actinia tenebrosa]XP_031562318.1 neuropeptide FF receptor 2-like [Actinia tenebrosa]XP_031562319.1 neuropeptide FF receptor 2-like [Actinia tenebrosa]XP_031562320.1 neuropeptide FF receptor 2-like [Actinia tenebrosa]XP_031562321.1 neuropeptide FF receptor 2-like [Actinia tenebrosa]